MTTYIKILIAGCGVAATAASIFLIAPGESATAPQSLDTTQGMVVVLDKESGTFRAPTTEESSQYQSPVLQSENTAAVKRRADGSESMKLDDSYTIYSTVSRRADGTWSRQCSIDHDHAQHAQKAVQ